MTFDWTKVFEIFAIRKYRINTSKNCDEKAGEKVRIIKKNYRFSKTKYSIDNLGDPEAQSPIIYKKKDSTKFFKENEVRTEFVPISKKLSLRRLSNIIIRIQV